MRLAAWIAVVAVVFAAFGRYSGIWQLSAIGAGLIAIAIGALIINVRDAWKGDDR